VLGCSTSSSPSNPDAEAETLGRASADRVLQQGFGLEEGAWVPGTDRRAESRVLLGLGTVSPGAAFMEIQHFSDVPILLGGALCNSPVTGEGAG